MSRTLSRLKKEGVIFLEMPLWKRASSCIEWRISWFSLSCGRKLWDTVDSHSGPQGPARVPSGKSSLHASCDGTLRIPLQSLPGLGPHLELRPEPQDFFPVLTLILGFLCSFNRAVMPHLLCTHASLLSFQAVTVVSVFLSS